MSKRKKIASKRNKYPQLVVNESEEYVKKSLKAQGAGRWKSETGD